MKTVKYLILFSIAVIFISGGCTDAAERQQQETKRRVFLLEKGDYYFNKGMYAEAYSYYKHGIPYVSRDLSPDRTSGYRAGTGRITFDGPSSEDESRSIVNLDSRSEECFYRAMECLVRLGKYDSVISYYERYIDVFPNYSGIDSVLENIEFIIRKYEMWGEEDGAIRGYKLLEKIDRFSRKGREAAFKIADYYFRRGNYYYGIEEYKDILAYFPDDPRISEVVYRLGILYYRLYRGLYYDHDVLDHARKYFERALKITENSSRLKSIEMYLEEIDEKKSSKLYFKAEFYLRRGDVDAALEYFKEILENYKKSSWAVKAAKRITAIEENIDRAFSEEEEKEGS